MGNVIFIVALQLVAIVSVHTALVNTGAIQSSLRTGAPNTFAPTTAAPTTTSPTTASPMTDAPTTSAPTTAEPTTAAPTTTEPTTYSPTTSSPTAAAYQTIQYIKGGFPNATSCVDVPMNCSTPPRFVANTSEVYSISGVLNPAIDPFYSTVVASIDACFGSGDYAQAYFVTYPLEGNYVGNWSCPSFVDIQNYVPAENIGIPCYCEAPFVDMPNKTYIASSETWVQPRLAATLPNSVIGLCADIYFSNGSAENYPHTLDTSTLYYFKNESACARSVYTLSSQKSFESIIAPIVNASSIRPRYTNFPCRAGVGPILCVRVTESTFETYVMSVGVLSGFNATDINTLCRDSQLQSTPQPTPNPLSDAPTVSPTESPANTWFSLLHFSYDTIEDKPVTYAFNASAQRDFNGMMMDWYTFKDYVIAEEPYGSFTLGAPDRNCMDWQFNETTMALNVSTWELVPVSCSLDLPILLVCANY